MNKKLVGKEIMNLLENIPSGTEDGLESDVENGKNYLWDEYGHVLDKTNLDKFDKLLSEQFNTETILDDKVELPIFEQEYNEHQTIEPNTTDLFLPLTSTVQLKTPIPTLPI